MKKSLEVLRENMVNPSFGENWFPFLDPLEVTMIEEAMKCYAQQVAEDVRKRCYDSTSESLETLLFDNHPTTVLKDSILNTEIILP